MSEDLMAGAVALAFTLLVFVVVATLTLKSLIVVVPPNMAAIIVGRKTRLHSGETVGYRWIIGERTLRVPFVETVYYMSLEPFPVQVAVDDAIALEDTRWTIEATALVRIPSEPRALFRTAVDGLLGKGGEEIRVLAQDTLEDVVRGHVATLRAEDVTESPFGSTPELTGEARVALESHGLRLDEFTVQGVYSEGE